MGNSSICVSSLYEMRHETSWKLKPKWDQDFYQLTAMHKSILLPAYGNNPDYGPSFQRWSAWQTTSST